MDALPRLAATTYEVQLPDGGLTELLPHLEPSGVWIREGEGMIGLGVAAETSARGSERFARLAHWWAAATGSSGCDDGTFDDVPGAGLIAFSSIAYSADSRAESRLIVPEAVLGSRQGRSWLTVITAAEDTPSPWHRTPIRDGAEPSQGCDDEEVRAVLARHGLELNAGLLGPRSGSGPPPLPPAELLPGTHPESHHLEAVAAGVRAIAERRLEKLVLARDTLAVAEAPLHPGLMLSRLATGYPTCWTYYAGEVLGATPEMLVKVRGEEVSARVLAGTVEHSIPAGEAQAMLLEDTKQLTEHLLAVESLLEQLAPVTEELAAAELPEVLELPNVYHLSTDVTGRLVRDCPREGAAAGALPPALLVAERAHPTAAVCGTPTATAAELISTLEDLDRGLFSGPIGWVDARGNADFGIALRGGVLEEAPSGETGTRIRLYAGGGIVAGSEPEAELTETRVKMRPMLHAIGLTDD